MTTTSFQFSPCQMTKQDFIATFGGVYEHSSWVAEQLWDKGLDHSHDQLERLAADLASQIDQADHATRLELIVSHPDLAGKAAQRGELTQESTSEQASAGIDQCNEVEFTQFQKYNQAYKNKFKFPFVMAVKGSNRHLILAAFEERLENDCATEFDRAISEIHKIARFRLEEIALTKENTAQNG